MAVQCSRSRSRSLDLARRAAECIGERGVAGKTDGAAEQPATDNVGGPVLV
jgi:hypothetical protein